jgi:hypothetical protein
VVTTYAGQNSSGFADGLGTSAKFFKPIGLAIDTSGVLFVADFANYAVRMILTSGQ